MDRGSSSTSEGRNAAHAEPSNDATSWIDLETVGELNDLAGSFWQEANLKEAEWLYQAAHRLNRSDPTILALRS
jgi:hypothetical protein